MERSAPARRFSIVDFPTFGRPMIATFTCSGLRFSAGSVASSCSGISAAPRRSVIASSIVSKP